MDGSMDVEAWNEAVSVFTQQFPLENPSWDFDFLILVRVWNEAVSVFTQQFPLENPSWDFHFLILVRV
jgi:hypothetical protein